MAKTFQLSFFSLLLAFSSSFSIRGLNKNNQLRISETAIYAGTSKGISISQNEGITWPLVELKGSNIFSIVSNGNGTKYVSTNSGLVKTTGDDDQWTNLTESLGSRHVFSYYITDDEQEIYIGSEYDLGNLRYTHNGGKTWGEKTIGNKQSSILGLGEIDGTIFALANNIGLYTSTNRGDSWKLLVASTSGLYSFATSFLISNKIIYIGTDSGVLVSRDQGKTWTVFGTKQGLSDDYIFTVFVKQFPDGQETIYVGTSSTLSISQNQGDTFKNYYINGVRGIYVTDDATVYLGTTNGITYSSDGINWFTATKDDGLIDNEVKAVYAEDREYDD